VSALICFSTGPRTNGPFCGTGRFGALAVVQAEQQSVERFESIIGSNDSNIRQSRTDQLLALR
jgi:hypothetical protein